MRTLPWLGLLIALGATLIGPCYVCLDATLPMWTGMLLSGLTLAFVSGLYLIAPNGTAALVSRGHHAYSVYAR